MKISEKIVAAILLSLGLAGCSYQDRPIVSEAITPPVNEIPPAKTLTASGYGTVSREQQYRLTPAQRKLMAIRASKVDALRALAEQVYGVRLYGQTTVEEMAIKNDNYRAFIDAFLRGARVRNTILIDRDTYETVMELDLTPTFYQCMFGTGPCTYHAFPMPSANTFPVPQPDFGSPMSLNCNGPDCYRFPQTGGFNRRESDAGFSSNARFTP